jgi:hypothetical protein
MDHPEMKELDIRIWICGQDETCMKMFLTEKNKPSVEHNSSDATSTIKKTSINSIKVEEDDYVIREEGKCFWGKKCGTTPSDFIIPGLFLPNDMEWLYVLSEKEGDNDIGEGINNYVIDNLGCADSIASNIPHVYTITNIRKDNNGILLYDYKNETRNFSNPTIVTRKTDLHMLLQKSIVWFVQVFPLHLLDSLRLATLYIKSVHEHKIEFSGT